MSYRRGANGERLTGFECWMANEINTKAGPASGCTKPCSGNGAETCGGPDRMNLYEYVPKSADDGTTDPDSSSTCTAVVAPAWALGCTLRGFNVPAGEHPTSTAADRAACASKCADANAGVSSCSSFIFDIGSSTCHLLAADAWAVVDQAAAKSDFKDFVLDDLACWSCAAEPPSRDDTSGMPVRRQRSLESMPDNELLSYRFLKIPM